MIPSERFAYFTLIRDAAFVTLAGTTMMVGASFAPAVAFKIGASVALAFAIFLLVRSYRLTDDRFRRCEAWLALRPDERPQGDHGREVARRTYEGMMLRFAKASAGVSCLLFGLAIVTMLNAPAQEPAIAHLPDVNGIVTAGTVHLR